MFYHDWPGVVYGISHDLFAASGVGGTPAGAARKRVCCWMAFPLLLLRVFLDIQLAVPLFGHVVRLCEYRFDGQTTAAPDISSFLTA